MKKTIYTVFAFAVFAASALANQATELDVKVPFSFKAGTSVLPAGSYRVTESVPGFLLIQGDKGGVFMPKTAIVLDVQDSGKIGFTFNRAGDTYVLQSVHPEK